MMHDQRQHRPPGAARLRKVLQDLFLARYRMSVGVVQIFGELCSQFLI
jgi:hypothetical protein